MDINFEYYKAFYYVAKYRNITKAAAAMGSNQPNLTRIMKLLEQELNCKLLVREARGISLTEEGERLFSHVEVAFFQLQNAQNEIETEVFDGIGTVEIGATETALHLYLLEALPKFKELYPKVRIKIHNNTTPEIIKNLTYGKLDFAVITTPFEIPNMYECKEIFSFQEILVGGSQYQELKDKKWNLKDLKHYSWVGLGNGTATFELYKDFFLKRDVDISLDMEVATSDLLVPLIRDNLGIGFVPEAVAEPWIREQKLIKITLENGLPMRELALVYDKGRVRSKMADRLQKYLLDFK